VRACDDEGCPGETRDCAGRVHMLWKIAVVSEHARVVVLWQERAWAEGSRGEARAGMPVPDGGGVRAAGGDRGWGTGPSTDGRGQSGGEEGRRRGDSCELT
jgi:hypothetical protein